MSSVGPPRSAAALGVFQALLLSVGAWYLWQRWEPAGILAVLALLAQLGGAGALLAGASAKYTRLSLIHI